MSHEIKRLRGECLCRNVGYEVDDAFDYALNCHCSDCRRATGSAFKPLAGIKAERLTVVRGRDEITRFGEGADHDIRCARCGSLLYSLIRDRTYVHVTLGTLSDTPSIRPRAHIFVGSKAPWFTIHDELPQFAEFPPE